MDRFELIEELCLAFGVSGFEDEVRGIIQDKVLPLVHESKVDQAGNLLAFINPGTDFTVMVDAHMDEIGLMVSYIEKEGCLRFSTLGAWDPRILPAHQVVLRNSEGKKIMGTLGMPPPHVQSAEEQKQPVSLEDLFIDVGAASAEEAMNWGVEVGMPGTLASPLTRLESGMIMGKALDNRAGCALLIEILEHFSQKPPDFTLVASFSVSEEVGLRGATTAAYAIAPHLALVLESTVGDTPGFPGRKQPSFVGGGAAVTLADKRIIVSPQLVRFLTDTARSRAIPFQYKTPLYGGTDAGAIHTSRGGVPTAVLSVPCRYIHSPNGIFNMGDYDSVLRLALSFLENARQAPGVGGK